MFGDIQTADNLTSDIMNRAKSLVQAVVQTQKQQRSEPYANALQQLGEKFASANAKMRPIINQQANKVRSDYIASGGSPIDLDQSLWGSDPSQGFQIGAGKFTPGYAGDNLSIGQKLRLAPIFGMFEGRPSLDKQAFDFNKQVQEAELTGTYKGKDTPAYQLIKSQIEQRNSDGSDLADWIFKQNYLNEVSASENAAKNKTAALESAYKYIEGIKQEVDDSTGAVIKPGWSTNTKAQMKQIVSSMLDGMIANGLSTNDVAANIRKKYPKTADDIINALYNAEAQLGK